jgi:stringent starvation protein B
MKMTPPLPPYLIRATYDWITESGNIPHILISTQANGVDVPAGCAQDDTVVFNISPSAVRMLKIDNHVIEFDARFNNRICHARIPIDAVIAIYDRGDNNGLQLHPVLKFMGNFGGQQIVDDRQIDGQQEKIIKKTPPKAKVKPHSGSKPKFVLVKDDKSN